MPPQNWVPAELGACRSLKVPAGGAKPTAQAIVSTGTGVLQPDSGMQAAGRPRAPGEQHQLHGARLKEKKIDPVSIWTTTKAKKNKFFEKYEKDFLDQPQPMRTDLELVIDGRDFIDIEIPPRDS